jgi:hypothetical protein
MFIPIVNALENVEKKIRKFRIKKHQLQLISFYELY